MKHSKTLPAAAMIAALLLASCSDGGVNAVVRAGLAGADGISGLVFSVRCDNGYSMDKYVAMHLGSQPGGGHEYADLFQTIPAPTKCSVAVTAMLDEKTAAPGCLQELQQFAVESGSTTELTLLIQCTNTPAGAGDVVSGVNHPPSIEMTVTEQYRCPGNKTSADIIITDPDGDQVAIKTPVVRFFDATGAEKIPPPAYSLAKNGTVWTLTPETDMPGWFEVSITAEDTHNSSRTAVIPVPVIACACCMYTDAGGVHYVSGQNLTACLQLTGMLVPNTFCK